MSICRRHLLQFANNEEPADLSKSTSMTLLSWMIRFFVPLVSEDPRASWTSMVDGVGLDQYITPSDLAFTLLILEHHIMKWRYLVQVERETGSPPTDVYCNKATQGLLYEDGIAGETAKRRFDELHVYFYDSFYCSTNQKKVVQLAKLQTMVNKAAKHDSAAIKSTIAKHDDGGQSLLEDEETKEDILHRVFYYLHV